MSAMAKIIAGIVLLVVGLLFLTGIVQALITVVGWIAIVAGAVVCVMGVIGLFKSDRGY